MLKRKIKKRRLIISSLFGSSIIVLMVSPLAQFAANPFIKMLFSLIIVYLAYGFKRFKYLFQGFLTFYFVSFVIGGGIIGIYSLLENEVVIMDGAITTTSSGYGNPISWLFVLICFPIVWYYAKLRINDLEIKKIHYEQIVKVKVEIEDVKFEIKGLIDSGNQLYDPITKTPVMIIDYNIAKNYFPVSIIEYAENINDMLLETNADEVQWERRLRIIPYRGVGQDHQFLLAVKPDYISVYHNNEVLIVKKALIALNPSALSTDDEYNCIVHPKMLATSSIAPAS